MVSLTNAQIRAFTSRAQKLKATLKIGNVAVLYRPKLVEQRGAEQ